MKDDMNIEHECKNSPSSLASISSLKTIRNPFTTSTLPLEPIYQVDSLTNVVGESNNGGIFLFETERHLLYTNKYTCILYSICIFGCWICTIPSVVATTYARIAAQNNQISRTKVMFNIAFVFSFFGLILFAVQAGYLTWTLRYLLHRFLTK